MENDLTGQSLGLDMGIWCHSQTISRLCSLTSTQISTFLPSTMFFPEDMYWKGSEGQTQLEYCPCQVSTSSHRIMSISYKKSKFGEPEQYSPNISSSQSFQRKIFSDFYHHSPWCILCPSEFGSTALQYKSAPKYLIIMNLIIIKSRRLFQNYSVIQ